MPPRRKPVRKGGVLRGLCAENRYNPGPFQRRNDVKIVLHNDTELSVSRLHEPGFDIDSSDSDLALGALQLCIVSLAWCTYSLLASYGQRIDAPADEISLRLRWRYAERPHRVAHVDMAIHWPQIPESRLDAAMRAAASCTVHNTLQHGLEIETQIERGGEAAGGRP